ncbi:MAG TPA: HAD-IA family hydrolase [Candidatus Saccharimonadales bacterium]|nr:HAD-IA family hydrolase [Candidatus Saccharimonadales bacterium]
MIKVVIFDYFGVIWYLRRRSQILKFATELRAQGISTPILSNVIKPIGWVLRKTGAYAGFEPVLLSGELGTNKPGPEIYKLVLSKLTYKSSECIFIDNRSENLVEPKAMGVHVVLAKNPDQIIFDTKKIIEEQLSSK